MGTIKFIINHGAVAANALHEDIFLQMTQSLYWSNEGLNIGRRLYFRTKEAVFRKITRRLGLASWSLVTIFLIVGQELTIKMMAPQNSIFEMH